MSILKDLLNPILHLGLFLMSFTTIGYSQEMKNDLRIKIEGIKYEQLCLRIILDNGTLIDIDGKSENKHDWTFSYSNSIYEKMKHKYLFTIAPDSVNHRLAFEVVSNSDTMKFEEFSFVRNHGLINLHFVKTTIIPKSWASHNKTLIRDLLSVQAPVDSQLMAVGKCLTAGYSMFAYDSLTDKQRFQKYIDLVREFPNSEYAIAMLSSTLTRYHSKADVQKIFSCFNEDLQHSYFGNKIAAYISDKFFKNSVLRSWNSEVNDSIVKATGKFTLVIFSASWCAPCHAEIPILKEIYKDHSGKLDMVYVSLDEPATVEKWKKMMIEEQIPWRSLIAADELKRIKENYYVEEIPLSILVYPGGHKEIVDVRHKDEYDKLCKLLQ